MSMRRHKNKIQALLDSRENYIYDSKSIHAEAIEYYQYLFNGNATTFYPPIATRVQINNSRKEYLSAPVTLEEIRAAVFTIDDSKSPGPDGFSAKFYKFKWDDLSIILASF